MEKIRDSGLLKVGSDLVSQNKNLYWPTSRGVIETLRRIKSPGPDYAMTAEVLKTEKSNPQLMANYRSIAPLLVLADCQTVLQGDGLASYLFIIVIDYVSKQSAASKAQLIIDASSIAIVDDFKYLGSYITSSEKDVDNRIALAWIALTKLKTILRSSKPKIKFKTRLFNAACLSVWLYGCKSRTLTEAKEHKLDILQKMLSNHAKYQPSRCLHGQQTAI
ncbi:hypothetical protein HELRODRAFT_173161 [Helobdella robusta]|uniref:Uncharacterized protein n=1 Tax=Helobdella robusta TaxID=6412 RepID=T1F6H3_HELRO|nr:hypothetical protein HELRODRAFT_173161 [Helobdella robusta]ESO04084.1 hypothetical protein HELRODRAFT_173161 [Helobdella robusta]